jgi:periplasmic protein TonB
MVCYNITIRDEGQNPTLSAGGARPVLSARAGRRAGFGLMSALLHAAAIGALVMVAARRPQPVPPGDAPVELVFEEPAVQPSPEITEPPASEPPPPEHTEATTPPPIAPLPRPPPDVATQPPPKPAPPKPKFAPPRPVVQAPREQPPVPQAGTPVPAAPVVDPGWQASVFGWLASRKTYPEEARRRGEEGRVTVRFTVDRSGRVVEAAIVSASGSALLDEAALGLLRQAVLPAFPADMSQARITITTTMRYSLR